MKKLLSLLLVLVLGLSATAFAVQSPVLPAPPVATEAVDGDGNALWVILRYNDQSIAELDNLARSVAAGRTELEHFALSEEDAAILEEQGFVLSGLSVDDLVHATVGGYTEKPANVAFKTIFTVPYAADTKVAVLMGVGASAPYQWTVEEGLVNADGTVSVLLTDFPADPFLLAFLS